MPLTDIETARSLVLERVGSTSAESVALREAGGRRLAAAVASRTDVPGFDNSAMDGYAVRSTDTAGAGPGAPCELRIAGESRAGHPAAVELGDGESIAISTGAMVPDGADAVVRVEDTERRKGAVLVTAQVGVGANIRRRGEDISAGDRLLAAGTRLEAAELGALAAGGIAAVECARRPRVAVLVTGDELVEPDRELGPGQIHDSNAYAVPPLATAAGAEVGSVAVVGDDREATTAAVERGLAGDVLVVCGGVSVGEHDHVRPALAALGVEEVFWGVALRPGKPTYFGVAPSGALAFGLPGNPVSAMVTFLLFVRPALLAMQGTDPAAVAVRARLAVPYAKSPGRAEAIRVRLEAGARGWEATPTGPQGSHVLTSMLGADGLAFAPADAGELPAGTELVTELLR
ncbi:MAG TPA: gephyrin-like molybdotransferase Glp [Solirubrobacterales bacterium]|nr:gephyrin-like molybdotransferase Glp [Solirubrobacterales bacterium]